MTISVAVIAWNESQTIDLALKSLKGFADEVNIVDTGSFDGTQAVARKMLSKLNLNGSIQQVEVKCLKDARFASLDACTGEWILILDANQVVSDSLKKVLKQHTATSKGKVCGFRSLNLMGDYEHYFRNLPFMNWHMAFFERGNKIISPGGIKDRPRFKSETVTTNHWAVNLSRVRPAWRSWYRGEPFDSRYFKKGDKNYALKVSYMDRWSRSRKYSSIVDFVEAEAGLSLSDVKKRAPQWYLEQLQRDAEPIKDGMRKRMPEVIKAQWKKPRYKLVYDRGEIAWRSPSL